MVSSTGKTVAAGSANHVGEDNNTSQTTLPKGTLAPRRDIRKAVQKTPVHSDLTETSRCISSPHVSSPAGTFPGSKNNCIKIKQVLSIY